MSSSDDSPEAPRAPPRAYRQKRRAERREETRRHIVDAVVALHRTVGPARTTISAVANQAGVERLTVYRHFANERELYLACSAKWAEEVPLPDAAAWQTVEPGAPRLRAALLPLYRFYRSGSEMLAHVIRDAERMPGLLAVVEPWREGIREWRHQLAEGWSATPGDRQRLLAALGHALRFETWRSLCADETLRDEALADEDAVELMVALVAAAVPAGTRNREVERAPSRPRRGR
jgi:AcrR family transcriptional regulator